MEPRSDSDDSTPPPRVDKTIIEGNSAPAAGSAADRKAEDTPLVSGKRIEVTQLGAANPYQQADKKEITDVSMLPSGKEPLPLGSGIIVGLLGTGGMARVYKIWNEKLEVSRAVKVLIPTQQKDLRNRFETEVKITAKLHHPNIVDIYSVGEWNGLPFLEMELIEGDSIEAIINRYGKLPFPVCSAIAVFVARALVYAHGQEFLLYGKNYHGVIHRDLKPANIMISKNGVVKLMDFGIARPTEASLHTVEGNIVGTMQYLSPEQIDGIAIDGRTDIYSFGAILYEMLTGTKTFPQETITNLMKKKIVNEYRKFTEFDFPISPAMVKITQRCLQSTKEMRFSSAGELLSELEATHRAVTNDDPTKVLQTFFKDPTAFYANTASKKTIRLPQMGSGLKKLIVPIAIAAVAVIAVIGIFLVVLRPSVPPRQNTAQAVESRVVPSSPQAAPSVPTSLPAVPPQTELAPQQIPVTSQTSDLKPLSALTPVQPPVLTKHQNTVTPVTQLSVTKQQHKTPAPENISVNKTPDKPKLTIEQLQTKYGTTDPVAIARNSLKAGKNTEAIMVLESTPAGAIDPKIKTLLLLEGYITAGRTKDAYIIANSKPIEDAQYDYLCGRLYNALGKNDQAITYLENALTKPSAMRKRNEIRDDALYYTALARSEIYRKNTASAENREQAQNAWNVVKRLYGSTPEHPRYKTANEQLASIK
jgi:eukaryotic-like serine/threonine-protein kinase